MSGTERAMDFKDTILLLHPVVAIVVVFPLIGIVVHRAIQTMQRRWQTAAGEKSKIPASAGLEHVRLGRWLAGSVVGVVLLAFVHDVFGNIIDKNIWGQNPVQVILITLTLLVSIASMVMLYRSNSRSWRGIFAVLTMASLIILGSQDGVYRNDEKWYLSHYYYGLAAAILMIFSVAILPEIYQDRTNRWRKIHIVLNSIAVLVFIFQAFTGALALLEIPVAWQKPYVEKLYEQQCDKKPCTVKSMSATPTPK